MNDMTPGHLLSIWTIRISLALLAAVVLGALAGLADRRWQSVGRWLWTVGWLLAVVHVVCVFQLDHGWSHARAVADTARRTAEQTGWEFGGGVYFNYAFLLVWGLDAGSSWLAPQHYHCRSRVLTAAIVGYLLFIAFNSTVVFGTGPIRYFAAAATAAMAWLAARKIWKAKPPP